MFVFVSPPNFCRLASGASAMGRNGMEWNVIEWMSGTQCTHSLWQQPRSDLTEKFLVAHARFESRRQHTIKLTRARRNWSG